MKKFAKAMLFAIAFSMLIAIVPMKAEAADLKANAIELRILDQVNAQRIAAGLSALTYNKSMQAGAETRAVEADQKWSHTRPNGQDYWTVDEDIYGENLSKDYSSVDSMVTGWMNSPAHRSNILFGDFQTAAVGVVQKADGTYVVAFEFGY